MRWCVYWRNLLPTIKMFLTKLTKSLKIRLIVTGLVLVVLGGAVGFNTVLHSGHTYTLSNTSSTSVEGQASTNGSKPSDASASSTAATQSGSNTATAPANTSSESTAATSLSTLSLPLPACTEESQITALQAQIQQDIANDTDIENEITTTTNNPYPPLGVWQEQLNGYESELQTSTQRYQDDSALLVSLDKDCSS